MAFTKYLLALTACILHFEEIYAHATVMDPVGRSSAWRKGFKTPKNYDDIELFCGGISVQHNKNKGKCGVCGDNYSLRRPRPNENGGKYGTGTIVQKYEAGQNFTTTLFIDSNHKGYFEFAICPLADSKELETEDCFDEHPIKLTDGSSRYKLKPRIAGNLKIDLVLPSELTCEHCVFRWHWKTAENWGVCEDGSEGMGCGPQEYYRSCSDITIE